MKDILIITLDEPDSEGNRVIKDFNNLRDAQSWSDKHISGYANIDFISRSDYRKEYKKEPRYHDDKEYFIENTKVKTFKQFLNEATDYDYEDLVSDVNDAFTNIKSACDKINRRFQYRLMINRSYNKPEANKITLEIEKELSDIEKRINKLWNKIG